MDDISQALLDGKGLDVGAARTILRYAVQRQIVCPYSGVVLDVRRAVLLDGSDYERTDGTGRKGRMDIMDGAVYDHLLSKVGGLDALQEKLGYQVDVLDGRDLFDGGRKS